MWPEAVPHFFGDCSCLELAHPAYEKRREKIDGQRDFCSETLLGCIYIPKRRETGKARPEGLLVGPAEAIMELMARSFAAGYVEAAGLQEKRSATEDYFPL